MGVSVWHILMTLVLLAWAVGVVAVIIRTTTRRRTRGDAPAGWYPAPDGSPILRYWDGRRWSDLPGHPIR